MFNPYRVFDWNKYQGKTVLVTVGSELIEGIVDKVIYREIDNYVVFAVKLLEMSAAPPYELSVPVWYYASDLTFVSEL